MIPAFRWPSLVQTDWIMSTVVDVVDEVFGHVVSGDGLSVGEVCHLTVDDSPGVVRSNLAQSTMSRHDLRDISIIFGTMNQKNLTVDRLLERISVTDRHFCEMIINLITRNINRPISSTFFHQCLPKNSGVMKGKDARGHAETAIMRYYSSGAMNWLRHLQH